MTRCKKVVVFGSSGAVGSCLVGIIAKNHPDWEVVGVPCSDRLGAVLDVLEDLDSMEELTSNVDMVYSCVELPRYQRSYWAEHWPAILENLFKVTSIAKPLVFCDNLYAYGPGTNISTNSKTLLASTKTKPEIRAYLRRKFEARMILSPRSLVVIGASDLFGPDMEDSLLGENFICKMLKGIKPSAIGRREVMHDFCYVPDLARALYLVSVNPNAFGRFWICPHSIHGETMEEIAEEVNKHLDEEVHGVRFISSWMLRSMALVSNESRELIEMLPWFVSDYTVNNGEFCDMFGVAPTRFEKSIEETVAFFKWRQLEKEKESEEEAREKKLADDGAQKNIATEEEDADGEDDVEQRREEESETRMEQAVNAEDDKTSPLEDNDRRTSELKDQHGKATSKMESGENTGQNGVQEDNLEQN
mmetsp:Transcript_13968/g.32403  ORF Transcript_13968/g.32403 Transcript_13968/m.32403 type:complete len:418 (+) Transcript_13968:44-1297(+)